MFHRNITDSTHCIVMFPVMFLPNGQAETNTVAKKLLGITQSFFRLTKISSTQYRQPIGSTGFTKALGCRLPKMNTAAHWKRLMADPTSYMFCSRGAHPPTPPSLQQSLDLNVCLLRI